MTIRTIRVALPRADRTILDNFGGKPLVDVGSGPEFAELAVAKLLRRSGHAYWVSAYPPRRVYIDWDPGLNRGDQNLRVVDYTDPRVFPPAEFLPQPMLQNLEGFFDVIAWCDSLKMLSDLRFYECKRKGKDSLRASQKIWLDEMKSIGCVDGQFAYVEWDYGALDFDVN